ncbi:MAG: hypothetical protein WC084_02220 [Synergistaceae bacterium]
MATGSRRRNIDIELETVRMVCYTGLEPVRKKKISSRTRSRNRTAGGWKASKATPIRNPPITIHITNLVSAIPPPLIVILFPI